MKVIESLLNEMMNQLNGRMPMKGHIETLKLALMEINSNHWSHLQTELLVLNTKLLELLTDQSLYFSPESFAYVSSIYDTAVLGMVAIISAGVCNLARADLYETYFSKVLQLMSSDQPEIKFKALALGQLLHLIGSDQCKWQGRLIVSYKAARGVYFSVVGLWNLDVASVEEGVSQLHSLYKSRLPKARWFPAFLALKEPPDDESALTGWLHNAHSAHVAANKPNMLALGVTVHLKELLSRTANAVLQIQLIDALVEIYEDVNKWGDHPDCRNVVIDVLWGCLKGSVQPAKIFSSLDRLRSVYSGSLQWSSSQSAKVMFRKAFPQVKVWRFDSFKGLEAAAVKECFFAVEKIQDVNTLRAENSLFLAVLQKRLGSAPAPDTAVMEEMLNRIDGKVSALQATPTLSVMIATLRSFELSRYARVHESQYVASRGSTIIGSTESVPLESVMGSFLASSKVNVLLLLGAPGAGKTTFCQRYANFLWEQHAAESVLPLFISMASLDVPERNAVEQFLESRCFTAEMILQIKRDRVPLVIFLDGVDETHKHVNWYTANALNEWNAKVVFTCRTKYCTAQQSVDRYFTPVGKDNAPISFALNKMVVLPFDDSQIRDYIAQVCSRDFDQSVEHGIVNCIFSHHVLHDLASTPFILYVLCNVLRSNPSLASEGAQLTESKLLEHFLSFWFEREEGKLLVAGVNCGEYFQHDCMDYAVDLASTMVDLQTEVFDTLVSVPPLQRFSPRHVSMKQLFGACPLTPTVGGKFTFIHVFVRDYLASKKAHAPLSTPARENAHVPVPVPTSLQTPSPPRPPQPLGGLLTDPHMLALRAESARNNPEEMQRLVDLVVASSKSPTASEERDVASSNALSILIKCGFVFNCADLRRIRVPYAVLDGGRFFDCNLTNAVFPKIIPYDFICMECHVEGTSISADAVSDRSLDVTNSGSVSAIEMHPDGVHVVVIYETHVYKYNLQAQSGVTLARSAQFAAGERVYVENAALDRSGSSLVCIRYRSIAKLSADSGVVLTSAAYHFAKAVAVSPSGTQFVTVQGCHSSEEHIGDVVLWELASFSMIGKLGSHKGNVAAVSYHPLGEVVVTAGGQDNKYGDFSIRVWDVRNKKMVALFNNADWHNPDPRSNWAERDINDGAGSYLTMWPFRQNRKDQWFITDLQFSRSGRLLASAGGEKDYTVRVWDFATKRVHAELRGHTNDVLCVSFSPDESVLVTASKDGTVRLWDLEDASCIHFKPVECVSHAKFSDDGKLVIVGTTNGRVLALRGFERQRRFQGHFGAVCSLNVHHDPERFLTIISTAKDGSIIQRSFTDGAQLTKLVVPCASRVERIVTHKTVPFVFAVTRQGMLSSYRKAGFGTIALNPVSTVDLGIEAPIKGLEILADMDKTAVLVVFDNLIHIVEFDIRTGALKMSKRHGLGYTTNRVRMLTSLEFGSGHTELGNEDMIFKIVSTKGVEMFITSSAGGRSKFTFLVNGQVASDDLPLQMSAVAATLDGRTVVYSEQKAVSGSQASVLQCFAPSGGQLQIRKLGHVPGGNVSCIEISEDGVVVACADGNRVHFVSKDLIKVRGGEQRLAQSMVLSPTVITHLKWIRPSDSNFLYVAGVGGEISAWSVACDKKGIVVRMLWYATQNPIFTTIPYSFETWQFVPFTPAGAAQYSDSSSDDSY